MKKGTLRRVLARISPYRRLVVCSLLLALLSAAAQLLIPIFCGNAIDAMLGIGDVRHKTVLGAIVCVAVAALPSASWRW